MKKLSNGREGIIIIPQGSVNISKICIIASSGLQPGSS